MELRVCTVYYLCWFALVGMTASFRFRGNNRGFSTYPMKGCNFYESIGKPKYFSAPMVKHSFLPFRLFVRGHGADLAFSQMISAQKFAESSSTRQKYIDWHLKRTEEEKRLDRPLIVQLAGHDPRALVNAAKHIQHQVSAVDVNMGCPQVIARKGNYGAYLLPRKKLIKEIFSTMINELDCAVTAKIRIQENIHDTMEVVHILEECGISMLTIHGRTLEQNKQYCGPCNWEAIRLIKKSLLDRGSSLPVIANGGIDGYDAVQRCLRETLCDGVMSSESLLENPKMFSEKGDLDFRTNYARCQFDTLKEYLSLVELYACSGSTHQDLASMKSHSFKILHRFLVASRNRDLLSVMSDPKACTLKDVREVSNRLEERIAGIDYDTDRGVAEGWITAGRWYDRHHNPSSGGQSETGTES